MIHRGQSGTVDGEKPVGIDGRLLHWQWCDRLDGLQVTSILVGNLDTYNCKSKPMILADADIEMCLLNRQIPFLSRNSM